MASPQPGVFALGTRDHLHLELTVRADATDEQLRRALAGLRAPDVTSGGCNLVVGLGPSLLARLASEPVPGGLMPFTPIEGLDHKRAPATQRDLWVWVHGTGPDVVFDVGRAAAAVLSPVAELALEQACFVYHDGRDMTGFVDGTANPSLEEAPAVALVADGRPWAAGGFAMTQRWVHDLASFEALPVPEQEKVFGRTKLDSVELDDEAKPANAHIARVELEVDGEEIELYRRSVPYGGLTEHGLQFVAFSADPARFDLLLRSMFGLTDGVRDRLTEFSRPVTGSYWFVPSVEDLAALDGTVDSSG